jgi:hypothetical protein
MFTAIKLFFGTPLGKDLLVGFAVLLILAATYSAGHNRGYDEGHSDGYTAGVGSQKPVVDDLKNKVAALTKVINDDRTATATKVKGLENDLTNKTVELVKKQSEGKATRTEILTRYTESIGPVTEASCGLSVTAVQAINDLLDTQIVEPTEVKEVAP